MRIWIDGEWNSFGGELISFALAAEDGRCCYVELEDWPRDRVHPWVLANVVPHLGTAVPCSFERAQTAVAQFLAQYAGTVEIIADWPEDIAHLCRLLIRPGGLTLHGWPMLMRIESCEYTSAVPHHALADAQALRAAWLAAGR